MTAETEIESLLRLDDHPPLAAGCDLRFGLAASGLTCISPGASSPADEFGGLGIDCHT